MKPKSRGWNVASSDVGYRQFDLRIASFFFPSALSHTRTHALARHAPVYAVSISPVRVTGVFLLSLSLSILSAYLLSRCPLCDSSRFGAPGLSRVFSPSQ